MTKRNIPNYLKILLGMLVGLILGLLATYVGFSSFITDWFSPFGDIFMRLLKFIAIPLVLLSLIKGIGGLKDIAKLATIGIKTIFLYALTTVIAISIGVSLAVSIKPGGVVSSETSQMLTKNYAGSLTNQVNSLDNIQNSSPLQGLVDMFPENAFSALMNNGAMLQVIIIAILIGVAVIMVGEHKSNPFMSFVSSLDEIVLKVVDIIMKFAPIGVAALISDMIIDSAGDLSLLSALGLYALTVVVGLLFLMYILYPCLVGLFTKIKIKDFIKAIIPVQLMGFTTSSSAATLSTTIKTADEVLKLPSSITSFTLPVGVTINMDGTSCYQAVAAIFIAQVMGIDLTFTQILIIIGTTTISSIGTPGVPGGSVVIAMMVLSSVGIPPEGLALILGVDRPLDMLRTAVNVTGDVAVSAIISETADND
ncbi:MAG: dicarboxylate/amino acid:cation symporter [Rikenellaceae bacterium]